MGKLKTRAPFRLLSAPARRHPRSGASFWLASFEPFRSLSTSPRKRHAMRSTDVCHSNDFRAPVLARSQLAPRLSSCGFSRRLGVSRFDRGRERFTAFCFASADRRRARNPVSHRRDDGRGHFPSHGERREQPLTFLSPLRLAFESIDLRRTLPLSFRGFRERKERPRSSSPRPRERT